MNKEIKKKQQSMLKLCKALEKEIKKRPQDINFNVYPNTLMGMLFEHIEFSIEMKEEDMKVFP